VRHVLHAGLSPLDRRPQRVAEPARSSDARDIERAAAGSWRRPARGQRAGALKCAQIKLGKALMRALAFVASFVAVSVACAQPVASPGSNAGTLVVISGSAEIELPNDEAIVTFFYEAQDAELAKAQGLVNQRVASGTAALKNADPKAQIETSGYGSFPVYSSGSARNIVGWRVRQGVTLKTNNLVALPATVASAQSTLSVGGVDFRLSRAAREKVDAQLIQQAIADLNGRLSAVAQALGVPPNRVRLEEVNFGGQNGGPVPFAARMTAMSSDASAAPPTFESGRSSERLMVSGKARLLP
jgi:uncharacterized protein YggE